MVRHKPLSWITLKNNSGFAIKTWGHIPQQYLDYSKLFLSFFQALTNLDQNGIHQHFTLDLYLDFKAAEFEI